MDGSSSTTPKAGRPWDLTHDPAARPLGCNGKSGYSGRNAHVRAGESVCETCLVAVRWAERERRRGQTYPKILKPCGTRPAAERHRRNNEPLDFACSVAEANYHRENRDARLEAQLEEVVL